ncbi:serine/threonine protein kinase, partial [Streptomonospora algeriensis]
PVPAPTKPMPAEDPGRPPAASFEADEPPRTLYSAGRLDEAEAQAQDLIDDERFAQAAGLLDDVVEGASAQWGRHSDRLADLRLQRAFALGLSGDIRRALPEFDALAAHFAAADGPDSERALECRHQAALCRAHLGESTTALRELQDVVGRMAVTGGQRDPAALDVRMEIGRLLVFTGRIAEAGPHLDALHPDLKAEYGAGDLMTREAADMLDRIRRAGSG